MRARTESASRVRKYRANMRRLGFRQINLWVPDTRKASFARECKRQSQLASRSGNEVLAGAEQVTDWTA